MIRIGDVRVVDFHVHFWATRPGVWPEAHPILQAYNRERDARMNAEWDFGTEREKPAMTDAEEPALADRWAAEVERYDLERVVFVMGSSNENLGRVIQRHPDKFAGLCFLRDPLAPGAADELRRGAEEWGLRGLKLLGPRVEAAWDDDRLIPIWSYLAERRMPALIHFGVLGKAGGVVYHRNMSPLTLAPVARRFPEVNFVIPHFGCGYERELLQLMWAFPNVYVDTSGSNQWMRWVPYPMDLDIAFRKYYETVGPRRIVFGTDSSWFPRGFAYRYLQDQVRTCRYLNFPEPDLQDIFAHNAERLLGFRQQ